MTRDRFTCFARDGVPMGRSLLFAAGLSVLSPWLVDGGAGALSAQGPLRPEVVSLQFEGNQSFSDEELQAAIITRQTECRSLILRVFLFCPLGAEFAWDRRYLSSRTLGDDLVRVHLFYRQRGFRDVQVDTVLNRPDDERVSILFQVDEGEPHRIASLAVLGVEGVEDPSVADGLPISSGDALDLVVLDIARDTLTNRLQNRGYAHAEVLQNVFIPAGTREAQVELDVYTGPVASFGPIDIVGNEEVADRVIRRMLPFGEGGLYRRELLFEAQRNIYGLEIFLNSSITEDLQYQPDNIVPLAVQVNEGNAHRVRAGGGWNTDECFNVESLWSHRNYFGGARRLQLRGRASNLLAAEFENSLCSGAGNGEYGELDWVLSADFSQPFIFSPRNSFAASIYAERQSLQNVFVRHAVGLSLSITRSVGRSTPLTLSYRPQLARLDAAEVFFCTSFLVCDPDEIDLLQASNSLSPVGLTLSRDRTNNAIAPSGGYRGLIDLESAGTWSGSDFPYERAVAELSGYHGLTDEVILAARIRGGWIGAGVFEELARSSGMNRRIAHPEKRFYAGGSNSVRGYAQNQLGPQVVSVDVDRLLLPVGTTPEGSPANPLCLPDEIVLLTCDASGLDQDRFFERPTGGTRLLEGNLEVRLPVLGSSLAAAAFVDFGRVWGEGDTELTLDGMAFTPGFGLRYATPIGPVRIDIAYRANSLRQVPVVTSQIRPFDPELDGTADRIGANRPGAEPLDWVRRGDLALLGPNVRIGGASSRWWEAIQLHFSIGEAF